MASDRRKACVTGGSGYVASTLVKLLLERGFSVNTTVRNPDNEKKVLHLNELKRLGDLKVFRADLTDDASFDAPIDGCEFVFHVATPINFASTNPEKDVIEPAVQGVLNVLGACKRSKSVKRVVFTSSAAAVCGNNLHGTGLVMDENNWTDVDHLVSEKPPSWGYSVSKTLAEKAAWKFAKENGIDLVTVAPPYLAGSSIIPEVPGSLHIAMAPVTGNVFLINNLKNMQIKSGFIGLTHVEDACRAHIFVAEKGSASGRYNCCNVNTSLPKFAEFLKKRYPHYNISTEFSDVPYEAKTIMSSEKLIREGFAFKYSLEDICDQSINVLKEKGILQN
ncbi:hypothetical protein MLD38_012123 [Melastoma candidum]|uniref:Uncharacterized protein n=1 Tax=Melastoma candidum TaxID=119954 RepID=A0ACB9R5A8_9MYRT|nr:hypothetical protein MLD38_012123 [Melastoma candidum]